METNGHGKTSSIAVSINIEARIDGRLVNISQPMASTPEGHGQILMAILTACCFQLSKAANVPVSVIAHAGVEAMSAALEAKPEAKRRGIIAPSPAEVVNLNRLRNKENP